LLKLAWSICRFRWQEVALTENLGQVNGSQFFWQGCLYAVHTIVGWLDRARVPVQHRRRRLRLAGEISTDVDGWWIRR
jgi:hypothetical protein